VLLPEFAGGDPLTMTLAGVELPGEAIGPVTIRRGRPDADQRPAPSTLSVALVAELLPALPELGDAVRVELGPDLLDALALAFPALAATRFVGTVTNAQLLPARGVVSLVAAGAKARAALYPIGDEPWPAELDGARATRILAQLVDHDPTIELGTIDPGTVTVLGRDVDRQPAAALLDDLAAYTGGDCWETRAGELVWHDARHRQDVSPSIELAARHVLVDPRFTKSLDGLVTDLTVGYGLEVFDPGDGSTSQATVRVADTSAPIQQLAARVSTPIASEFDAQRYAVATVGRRSRARWAVPDLEVDMLRTLDPDTREALLYAEPAELVRLVGMPSTAPFVTSQLWLEGWVETYTRAAWRMSLAVTPRGLTGAQARWIDIPDTWQPPPPAEPQTLTWLSEPFAGYSWIGTAGWWIAEDIDQGRWADVPASLRWGNYPSETEWGDLA
jgi:hypothetical protein